MLTIVLSFLVIALIIVFAAVVKIPCKQHKTNTTAVGCDANACGAMDPVSDPDYNMKQIVKQSILVEEHLTQDRKRCKDCITKHLLHIQGLAEEAAMLAGAKAGDYPLLIESVAFYDDVLKRWIKEGRENVAVQLEMATDLRKMRKEMAAAYFLET